MNFKGIIILSYISPPVAIICSNLHPTKRHIFVTKIWQ